MPPRLTVTFLGTSSAAPTRDRGLPAIAVQREGEVILMDCGEGVQRQAIGLGVGLNRETTILITHLHGDHVSGLLGLLQTMGLAQRKKKLRIVGPAGLEEWLDVTSRILNVGLTFEVEFIRAVPGRVIALKEFKVRTTRAVHSVEAFAYLVEERARPGVFFPKKAKRLGIPEGKLWSRLQKGKSVEVHGKVVSPRDVTGPPRPGRRIGYSGDSRPSPSLARFFKGCDLLVFDSTFKASDRDKAVDRKHSTCVEAAQLARTAAVRSLALTHFSARYQNVAGLVKEAKAIFPKTFAAKDGLVVEVPYSGS